MQLVPTVDVISGLFSLMLLLALGDLSIRQLHREALLDPLHACLEATPQRLQLLLGHLALSAD